MTKKADYVEPVADESTVVVPEPTEVAVLFSDEQIAALKKGGKLVLNHAQMEYLRTQLGAPANISPDGYVIDKTKP